MFSETDTLDRVEPYVPSPVASLRAKPRQAQIRKLGGIRVSE